MKWFYVEQVSDTFDKSEYIHDGNAEDSDDSNRESVQDTKI